LQVRLIIDLRQEQGMAMTASYRKENMGSGKFFREGLRTSPLNGNNPTNLLQFYLMLTPEAL